MTSGTDIMTQNFAKIADYLDCSIDYLLGRDKFVTAQTTTDYDKLDIEDKAEIRGMIKQMLKADKYKKPTAMHNQYTILIMPLILHLCLSNTRSIKIRITCIEYDSFKYELRVVAKYKQL